METSGVGMQQSAILSQWLGTPAIVPNSSQVTHRASSKSMGTAQISHNLVNRYIMALAVGGVEAMCVGCVPMLEAGALLANPKSSRQEHDQVPPPSNDSGYVKVIRK